MLFCVYGSAFSLHMFDNAQHRNNINSCTNLTKQKWNTPLGKITYARRLQITRILMLSR